MGRQGTSFLRESRWLSAAAVLTVTALLPLEANASSKLANDKALLTDVSLCAATSTPLVPASASRAILGGAPSALDRIRANQNASVTSAPAPVASMPSMARLVLPPRMNLEPASRTPIDFAPPLPATDSVDCAPDAFYPKMSSQPGFPDFSGRSAVVDPLAELGTRAIPVKRTRFDDRWERVRHEPAAGLMQAQLHRAQAHAKLGERELLQRVNQWVNRQIAYVNDDVNYGQRDLWATADQTLARGKGDCEDFAILKMHMLRAAGIDPDSMKLVLLRDLAANSDHAFLLVDTREGKLVLDNTTDRIYDGHQPNSVRPVLSFSGSRRWVHAYRDGDSSPFVAMQPAAAKRGVAIALNNQRSVSAELLTFKTGLSK